MQLATPDRELLSKLDGTPEFALSGFNARLGLMGAGVTVLKGSDYFGSWSLTEGQLVWMSGDLSERSFVARSVEDAVLQTFIMILRNLETARFSQMREARAG